MTHFIFIFVNVAVCGVVYNLHSNYYTGDLLSEVANELRSPNDGHS